MDTSAFLAGFDPFRVAKEQFTVSNVEEEIRSNSMTWMRFKAATENGKVIVKTPSEAALKRVEEYAIEAGDSFFLSETDKHLLALPLDLNTSNGDARIITDDYSIQNVAKRLGIEFKSLATFGISRCLEWMRYCPACRREYAANFSSKECTVCGTELKRKPRKHFNTSKRTEQ